MGTKKTTSEMQMPEFQQKFLEGTVIPFAEDFLATEFKPYEGELVAGMTPLQLSAMEGYGALTLPSEFATASDVMRGVATMTPEDLAARRAGYAQEYTDLVLDPTRQRLKREQDIARSVEAGQMTKALGAGGFGSSRRGIAEGEREAARDVAMAAMEADIGARGLDYGTQRLMSDLGLTTGAAASLAGLGGQRLAAETGILGSQMGVGEAARLIDQQGLEALYNQYMLAQNYPLTQFGVLTGAAGAVPSGYGTTIKTERDPMGTIGGILGGIGSAGKGLSALGWAPFSDARLKENIRSLGQVGDFNLYEWDWNEEGIAAGAGEDPTYGVIAQEVEKIRPEYVVMGDDGYRRVNYGAIAKELGAA